MKTIKPQLREIHSLGKDTRESLVSARQIPSLATHGILFTGHTDAKAGYQFVRHAPDFHQILAVTAGEGRVWVGNRWGKCTAGQAYITPAGAFCAYEKIRSSRWQLSWILYEKNPAQSGLTFGQAPRVVPADTVALQHAIVGLCHEAAMNAEPASLELWSALIHRQSLRILHPSQTDQRLDKLWLMVSQDLRGCWDLSRLARAAGMSDESLRRLCLKYHGAPPLAHLTRLRMQYAADLLAYTREKISTIATLVGYEDAFAFSNAFKRIMGYPPSKIRSGQT